MDFDSNTHSVFRLNYHLVLVIKYRRKVIDDEISNRLKGIFEYIETIKKYIENQGVKWGDKDC